MKKYFTKLAAAGLASAALSMPGMAAENNPAPIENDQTTTHVQKSSTAASNDNQTNIHFIRCRAEMGLAREPSLSKNQTKNLQDCAADRQDSSDRRIRNIALIFSLAMLVNIVTMISYGHYTAKREEKRQQQQNKTPPPPKSGS